MNERDPEITSDETRHCSPELSISSSRASVSSSSKSVLLDSGIACTPGASFSGSRDAFISDVDSVAWGLCGNTCDQHEEASFQELLFVSGKHGVVVHAFQFNESSEVKNLAQTSDVGNGMWAEWGPSTTLSPVLGVQEEPKCHLKASGERSNSFQGEPMVNSQSATPKQWLRTFLTKVESLTYGNDVCTRFPKKLSFPNDVVVSFRIFDQDSQFLDFLPRDNTTSCDQMNCSMPFVGTKSDMDLSSSGVALEDDSASKSGDGAASSLYKCSKVFSNNSYNLVGFAIAMINPINANTCSTNGGNESRILIAVARIVSWGLQWLYSAKPDKNLDRGPFEWTDFTFSHKFLICLSTSGLILFYCATTGVYIASLDFVNISGPGYCLSSQDLKHDGDVANKMHGKLLHSVTCKRRFKRLFVFPHSSLLGVMDECGVTYILVTDNHIPEDNCSSKSIVPYQHYPDLGILTSWEVGGAGIGYQKVLCNTLAPGEISRLPAYGKSSYFVGSLPGKEHLKNDGGNMKDRGNHRDSLIFKTDCTTQIMNQKKFMVSDSDFPSRLMRTVFLPPSGYREDDVVCCSPFGITRLIKRNSCEQKRYQVVHANLQLDFVMNDEINYSKQGWETSSSEAVGCNFLGFLYLVTEKGLSVVLPSISVPSNFPPVEAIGYNLPKFTSSIKCGAGNLMGVDETKKPWSPWKVEVLDRALLHEGTDVAEHLCLENGKNFLNKN